MTLLYEVWDTGTNNMVGCYDNEADALALVRAIVSTNGESAAEWLALIYQHEEADAPEAEPDPIDGHELLVRAHAHTAPSA